MNYQAVKLEAHYLTRNSYVLGLVNGRMMIGVSFERGTWKPARLALEQDAKYFVRSVPQTAFRTTQVIDSIYPVFTLDCGTKNG